ncbi:MAG: ABC transporter permease subunit [Desulfobulbaceae bacterium]|jgi:ABC-type transport system involved in multi-copper enzyme maturation permease subunit|nr:ABC transporter permease subunit [Desulfobulbaceae bacterium]
MLSKIWSLALLVILDGLRRHALIGLLLLALLLEAAGLFFFQFIPRDIGRASADFILSIGWLTGFLFLFFHAVQVMAWDEERRTIHTLLARPISRGQYVLGIYLALALLILALNIILAGIGYGILEMIQGSVKPIYFTNLSLGHYALAWLGLYFMELVILSVILFFSGLVRGGFPVLLLSVSYYFICVGLPVVREAVKRDGDAAMSRFLKGMTAVFPDFSRFDFKSLITTPLQQPFSHYFGSDCLLVAAYVAVTLMITAVIYQKRDLQ